MTRASLVAAAVAGAGMATLYAGVLVWAGGTEHLQVQAAADWWLLAPIVATFAAQVGVMVELRARRAAHHLAGAGGAASGASVTGMVACCAHHLVELAPLAGLTGVAVALADIRIPLMAAGLALNVAVLALAARRLRGTAGVTGAVPCAA